MASNPYVNKVQKADGTTIIDISDTTAAATDVLSGTYFYTAAGERTEGLFIDPLKTVPLTWEQGSINASNGANASSSYTIRTNYIETTPGEQFIKYNLLTGLPWVDYCYFYDANKTYLSRNHTNIAPENAAYMRTTYQVSSSSSITPAQGKNYFILRMPTVLSVEVGGRAIYSQTNAKTTMDIDVPLASGERYFFMPIEWGGPTATSISLSGKSGSNYISLGSVSGVFDFKAIDVANDYTGFRVTVASSTPSSSVPFKVILMKVGWDKVSTLAYALAKKIEQIRS